MNSVYEKLPSIRMFERSDRGSDCYSYGTRECECESDGWDDDCGENWRECKWECRWECGYGG